MFFFKYFQKKLPLMEGKQYELNTDIYLYFSIAWRVNKQILTDILSFYDVLFQSIWKKSVAYIYCRCAFLSSYSSSQIHRCWPVLSTIISFRGQDFFLLFFFSSVFSSSIKKISDNKLLGYMYLSVK